MAHDIDLIGYLDNSLSKEKKEKTHNHLTICPGCRSNLEELKKSILLFTDIYKKHPILLDSPEEDFTDEKDIHPSKMVPLPEEIKNQLGIKEPDDYAKLKQALLLLKARGGEKISRIIKDVETLAEQLFNTSPDEEPAYALEQDITMSAATDLNLRHPGMEETASFQLEDYTIEIKKLTSKTQIKITKDNTPVTNIHISLKRGADTISTLKTNEEGMIFY